MKVRDKVVIVTAGTAELTIPTAEIRSVRLSTGASWFPNPNRTRLLFAPTARPLPRGTGYFASHLIFFPSVNYGVTDSLTLGAGVSLFPGTALDEQLAFVTPKFGWRVGERSHIGAGVLLASIPGDGDDDLNRAGIAYTVGTWGTPDASVTAGFGYGYTDEGLADRPMVVLGGERRLSSRPACASSESVCRWIWRSPTSSGKKTPGYRCSASSSGSARAEPIHGPSAPIGTIVTPSGRS